MRLSHADFRPGKRQRFVPSGPPRRKIPLLRIAMLLALGLLVYTRFDDYWPRVRDTASAAMSPAALWRSAFGTTVASAPSLALVWSRDSSRVTLECPRGLTGACCEALKPASPDLCAEASALLAKARWKKALAASSPDAPALRLEGRAVVSDLGDWSFELSGVGGRDPSGAYRYRRASGSMTWCDARRGCLKDPLPRAPLANGRLHDPTGDAIGNQGLSLWTAGDPEVRAVLPGRVVATDTAKGANGVKDGTIVRVYHGRELYAAYGPLQAAAGVKPGALLRSGSHLGFAPRHRAGYALHVHVRQAGQNLDPATFWGITAAKKPLRVPI